MIDGGGGFGQAPSIRAMDLAVEKARAFGIGAVGVRNSNHFGAAGGLRTAGRRAGFCRHVHDRRLRGFDRSDISTEARFGTNPIALAAPARHNRPFLLDMATSTVALGKFKLYAGRTSRSHPVGLWTKPAGRRPTPSRRLSTG